MQLKTATLAHKVGDFIDVLDTVSKWCVALVTAVDPQTGLIDFTFVGWGSKYDERNVDPSKKRIAPFRSKTRGYTGQNHQLTVLKNNQEPHEVSLMVKMMGETGKGGIYYFRGKS
jgi:hypothetical protein